MKDYKWGKFIGFMVICAIIGFVAGGALNMFLNTGDISGVKTLCISLAPNLFFVATVCGVIGLIGFVIFNQIMKKDGYSNEEGSVFDRYENIMSVVLSLSTICAILNFTAFGINLTLDLTPLYLLVFMLNVALAFAGEVANISLIKKVRPELNADPTQTKFKNTFFDQLDEMEKIKMGKVCYKTMSSMTVVYVGMFLACWAVVLIFEVSPVICLPIGIIWLIQTILNLIYDMKK